jgi:hypothetical protein
MKAYKSFIKYALAKGHTVSVFDGEEWGVKRSTKYTEIVGLIEDVEIAELRVRDADGNVMAWAQVIPDLEDDETLADYSANDYTAEWDAQYSN